MKLTKYSPISPTDLMDFTSMPVRFSDILDEFFNDAVTSKKNTFHPNVDISEDDKSYSIKVELPGMKKDDISVNLDKNKLTISGERKFEKEEKNKHYHLVESGYGSFSRSFILDEAIDKESIDANFENGILNLVLTKKESEVSRKIDIK